MASAENASPADRLYLECKGKLSAIESLCSILPDTVPEGTSNDLIAEKFSSITADDCESEWQVLNRRFDAIFGKDKRDEHGRLAIRRGKLGMGLVIGYLEDVFSAATDLPWAAVVPKLDNLVGELEFLTANVPNKKSLPKLTIPGAHGLKEHIATIEDKRDKDYKGGTRRPEPSSPAALFDSDGEEVTESTEAAEARAKKKEQKKAKEIAKKQKKKATEKQSEKAKRKKTSKNSSKRGAKPNQKKRKNFVVNDSSDDESESEDDIDSGSESDGESALRRVEEQEQAKGARRGPANDSMKYFRDPVPVVATDKKPRWQFKCKNCSTVRTFPRTLKGENISFDDEPNLPKLNNLATHIKECKGRKAGTDAQEDSGEKDADKLNLKQSAALMEAYLKEGELNPMIEPTRAGFLRLFAAFILDESLPWTTGEAPSLKLLFKYLRINYQLPSDTTVRNQLTHIFAELHAKIVREFTNVKSKIAYAEDTWTNRQMVYTFACTVGCFINEDWELIERVVDFKPLEDKEHEGLHAGKAFVDGASQRGGANKISFLFYLIYQQTAGRCLLARYGIPFNPDCHIRCIAHVVNLVVQSILHEMCEGDDPDDVDWYKENGDVPFHYNADEDEEVCDLQKEKFDGTKVDGDDTVDEDESAGYESASPLKKLRFICNKIVSSPQRRRRFYLLKKHLADSPDVKKRRLADITVIRDVRTRWNYTHAMIRRAEDLQTFIDTWCFETKGMRGLLLKESEWKLLGKLADVLEVFTQVTLQMSNASQPTLPFSVPMYHKMHTHLTDCSMDSKFPDILRNGAEAGLAKLTKYYDIALKNQYCTIATVLHPSLRSAWFRNLGSTNSDKNDRVEKAETVLKHVAHCYQETIIEEEALDEPRTSHPSPAKRSTHGSWLDAACHVDMPEDTMLQVKPKYDVDDELKQYFKFAGGRGALQEPLYWWRENQRAFPILSRMARDFLAIPATSVSVERVFSKSRHICTDLRSSLKANTIKEALLSKVWIRSGLFEVNEPPRKRRKHGSDKVIEIE